MQQTTQQLQMNANPTKTVHELGCFRRKISYYSTRSTTFVVDITPTIFTF